MKNKNLRPRSAVRLLLPVAAMAACLIAAPAISQTISSVAKGHIIVKKFYDANANGVRDPYEPWLSGWPMTLTGNGQNSTLNSTATWWNLPVTIGII